MYFATHWTCTDNLGWNQNLAGTATSKGGTRCVKSTWNNTHTKKQTRKINRFELLFILAVMTGSLILIVLWKLIGSTIPVLYGLNKFSHTLYGHFCTGPVCCYQKSYKPCQWSHDLCDRPGIFKQLMLHNLRIMDITVCKKR